MTTLPTLILADDLTGACDTGAGFAGYGLRAVVRLPAAEGALPEVDALVISTESRYLPAALAEEATAQVIARLGQGWRVYKKIDSTLRGHPARDLAAVLRGLGIQRALIAPAFPAQARVTRGGIVYVSGKPLAETSFGQEVGSGNLLELFGEWGAARRLSLADVRGDPDALAAKLAQDGLWIADAETDADLTYLARAGLRAGLPVWCGSAGLARALAQELAGQAEPVKLESPREPLLVAAGSRHPSTQAQIGRLEAEGAQVIALTVEDLRIAIRGRRVDTDDSGDREVERQSVAGSQAGEAAAPVGESRDDPAALLEDLARRAVCGLRDGQVVVLCARGAAYQSGAEQMVAASLAEITARVMAAVRPGLLALTGGDTAAAVCERLGCGQIRLLGEVQPGLALGEMLDGACAGQQVVTKAGGFGADSALVELTRQRQ